MSFEISIVNSGLLYKAFESDTIDFAIPTFCGSCCKCTDLSFSGEGASQSTKTVPFLKLQY
jgi:hypothetical protein